MKAIRKSLDPGMYYHADIETIEKARYLRSSMTRSEKELWKMIRRRCILGIKFRRQHPIFRYIADFYCHEIRLVIEVDGKIHELKNQRLHDENRTAFFGKYDIEVIRFTNEDVALRKKRVKSIIEQKVLERLNQRPHPPSNDPTQTLPLQGRAGRGPLINQRPHP